MKKAATPRGAAKGKKAQSPKPRKTSKTKKSVKPIVVKPTADPIAEGKNAKIAPKVVSKVPKIAEPKQQRAEIATPEVKEATEKHAGGRPSDYHDGLCDLVIEFFCKEPFTEHTRYITRKDGSTVEEQYRMPAELPTLAAFACQIGVHRDTIHEWTKKHPKFSDAIKRAKENQERILVTNGLCGLYEGPFSIFTAKNVLGWRDKIALGGDEDNPAPIAIAAKATDYDKLRAKLAQHKRVRA